jgi:hypothetical protein
MFSYFIRVTSKKENFACNPSLYPIIRYHPAYDSTIQNMHQLSVTNETSTFADAKTVYTYAVRPETLSGITRDVPHFSNGP